MTPEKIVETYMSVENAHNMNRNFGMRIIWFVGEVALVMLLINPAFTRISAILVGLLIATTIISLSTMYISKRHYETVYSVSSVGFIKRCLKYETQHGNVDHQAIDCEDIERVTQLTKSAVTYLRLTRINLIANIFLMIFCLGFLILGILQIIL
jgi:hypothetical protein